MHRQFWPAHSVLSGSLEEQAKRLCDPDTRVVCLHVKDPGSVNKELPAMVLQSVGLHGVKMMFDATTPPDDLQTLLVTLCEHETLRQVCFGRASLPPSVRIPPMPNLSMLCLSNMHLGSKSPEVRAVLDALQVPGCRLEVVVLAENDLDDEFVAALARVLPATSPRLRVLGLSRNKAITNGAALEELCRRVPESSVQKIMLSPGTSVGDLGVSRVDIFCKMPKRLPGEACLQFAVRPPDALAKHDLYDHHVLRMIFEFVSGRDLIKTE